MPLLAQNCTTVEVTLSLDGGITWTLPPAASKRTKGVPINLTSELATGDRSSVVALVIDGTISLHWDGDVLYQIPGLVVGAEGFLIEAPAPMAGLPAVEPALDEPVFAKVVKLLGNGFDDCDGAINVFGGVVPYDLRIVSVFGAVSRGAAGSTVYLCTDPLGGHPLSDRFDTSSSAPLVETTVEDDRIVRAGETLYVYYSTCYVAGYLTLLLQRI